MLIRERYHSLFAQYQSEPVHKYNSSQRLGNGLRNARCSNWLFEAQRTGEFFPGREQVRPGVDFGKSSKKKNVRSCRINYSKSDSHSPGIFTVQCACRHPKLIGYKIFTIMN